MKVAYTATEHLRGPKEGTRGGEVHLQKLLAKCTEMLKTQILVTDTVL